MNTKPVNQVLLSISKPIQDEITTESGVKLFYDGSYNKNWAATVTAKVSSLPLNPPNQHKKIFQSLKEGDQVCVSYRIVSDFSFQGDADRFMQCTEDNPHLKEFVNGRGYWIRMYALPKISGIKGHVWVGMYMDSRMQLIDGMQGEEEEMYRWAAQFPFGKTDIYTFNNFFEFENKNYWRADLDDIFAIKRKGHLVAVGDRIICIPIDEEVPHEALIAAHQGHKVKIRYTDRARVLSGGKSKGIKKDEIISFDPKIVERYEFFGKQYYLVKEDFVLGKWN